MAARSRKKKNSTLPLVAGIVFLILVGGGLYWFHKTRPDQFRRISYLFIGEPETNSAPTSVTNRASTNWVAPPVQSSSNSTAQPTTNGVGVLPKTNPPVAIVKTAAPPVNIEIPLGPKRPVRNVLEAQVALARLGISTGCIDGGMNENTRRALLAWQIHNGLPVSGELDGESKAALLLEEPLIQNYAITQEDLSRIMKVPSTWVGKSEAKRLDYESLLELVAEKGRSSTAFIRKLNPGLNWTNVPPGTVIKIPRVPSPVIREKAAFVRVHLYSKTVDVFNRSTNLIAHFPCSIAAKVEKRPIGILHVQKFAANPTYLFDPAVFTESPEARKLGRKLMIPPGPNNPVGTAWIGLDRPGYGLHGTPKPEQIGRTESHGCFRLANWNADHLLQLSWVGLPVIVEP
ncbi:MAG: L,D-transpeptidase family protein [Verrucomicrobiota bacterium]